MKYYDDIENESASKSRSNESGWRKMLVDEKNAKILDLNTKLREKAIDDAIIGAIKARQDKIIDEVKDVMQSDDPLYSFFMGVKK